MNQDSLLNILTSLVGFVNSFSIMGNVYIFGLSFSSLVFIFFTFILITFLQRDENLGIISKIIICITLLCSNAYIGYKFGTFDIVSFGVIVVGILFLFPISYVKFLQNGYIITFILIVGISSIIGEYYITVMNNWQYSSYNIITYQIDKVGLIIDGQQSTGSTVDEKSFTNNISLFRYYYNLSRKKNTPQIRTRLYELRSQLTDVEEYAATSKIFYDANKYYGTDYDNNIYFCGLNGSELLSISNTLLLRSQMKSEDAVSIYYMDKYYVTNLKRINCRAIKSENIIPSDIKTKEQASLFVEVLGRESLFGGISDDLFDNLRQIKQIGTVIKDKVSNKEERIRMIYIWIAGHIEYDKTTSDNLFEGKDLDSVFSGIDNKYHSGILTYKNKKGVCTGYSNLFYLMSVYAGIDNVEVVLGKSYDSTYKGYVGHAWNKIGDYYYDTTYESTGNKMLSNGILLYYKKTLSEMQKIDNRIADTQKLNPIKIIAK